ncbi:MAG: hypothetical protein ACI82H_000039 [Alphaproteobacteria bacterium]|jgi:hypothetical protein
MTPKSFAKLLVITLVAVLAAIGLTIVRDTGSGLRGNGTLMFEDLAQRVNDVAQIKVTRADGISTLDSKIKDGKRQWSLKELYGYPVPIEIVRAVAAGVAQLRLIESKTARPKLYGRLRVNDPKTKGAKGALVELFDTKGAKMAELIVGLDKGNVIGISDVYVRRPNEERAWLAHGKVPVPDKRINWLNTMITEVDLPRVRETTLFVPGQKPLRVFKKNEDERDFTLEGMPKDRELKELFGAEDISRSIQQLAFEDVKLATAIGFDFSGTPRTRHTTFDGLIVEVWAKEMGGKLWVAVKARPDPTPKEPKKVDAAKIAKEVAKINTLTSGWAFVLNPFETKNLNKTMANMTQPKDAAPPAPKKAAPKK